MANISNCQRVHNLFKNAQFFIKMANTICSHLHENTPDFHYRENVGPEFNIGNLSLVYSRGSSLSKRHDHIGGWGCKIWIPTKSCNEGVRRELNAFYNQAPIRIGKWFKLPVNDEQQAVKLIDILKRGMVFSRMEP